MHTHTQAKRAKGVLNFTMVLQLIIIGLYIGLLVWPFYKNGLHLQPRMRVLSGAFEPGRLPTFCSQPASSPEWMAGRCADGTDGKPWRNWLLGAAMFTVLLGPVALCVLGIITSAFLIRTWANLGTVARASRLAQCLLNWGAAVFMWGTPFGSMLAVWILD